MVRCTRCLYANYKKRCWLLRQKSLFETFRISVVSKNRKDANQSIGRPNQSVDIYRKDPSPYATRRGFEPRISNLLNTLWMLQKWRSNSLHWCAYRLNLLKFSWALLIKLLCEFLSRLKSFSRRGNVLKQSILHIWSRFELSSKQVAPKAQHAASLNKNNFLKR